MTQKGHPLLHLTTVFVTGTTTALLQGAPQHLLQPDHRIWERSTTAFVKGSTTVCLNGRPQHYLRSLKDAAKKAASFIYENTIFNIR